MQWQGRGRKGEVLVETEYYTSIFLKGMIILITMMMMMMMIQKWYIGPHKLNVRFKYY